MMAQDIGNADIPETTVSGRRVDKYSVLAETAYIETVDQNVAVLPRGRSLNPNAASLIVLTTAPHYSEVTNSNLTTVADDDPGPSPASIVAGSRASQRISIGVSPAVTQIGPRCTSPDLSFVGLILQPIGFAPDHVI